MQSFLNCIPFDGDDDLPGGGCGRDGPENADLFPYADESEGFLLTGYLFAALVTGGVLLYSVWVRKEKITLKIETKQILPIAMIGMIGAVIGLLFLRAMAFIPTSVLSPINNGGRLILITIMDVLLFKQKLTVPQYAGLASGITAIILLSI